MRIGIRGIATVESGHVFTEPSLQVESDDFLRDQQLFTGKMSKDSQEADAELSLRPTRCLTTAPTTHLEPISWNDMAAFHARHLLDSVWQKYYFERNYWGVKDKAEATASWADKSLSSIRLYPLVKLSVEWLKLAKPDDTVIASLTELLAKSPEDVNCELCQRIEYCVPDKSKVPGPASWFVPQYPLGTAFDYSNRRFDKNPELTTEQLKALVDLAPHNEYLIYDWECAKYGTGKATEDQLIAAFGPLADIDIRSMQTIAEATENDPSKHIKSLQRIAQYKPDMYFKLGDYLVAQKRIDEAVKAYETGVEKARNAVLLANSSAWLVNYYYDHGQKEKALKLAQDAAEVYSAAGLLTLANLYERMGKFDDAEEYFQKENERYEADKYGLKAGDVFVAVDGYSVQNTHQYQYAADLNVGPNMEFIIWNGKEYRTVKAMLPSRRFGCAIKEFPAPE